MHNSINFQSWQIVCTGAKTIQQSLQAAHKYARKIQKLDFDVKFKNFSIQNVVGSSGIGFPLDLDVLANKTYANYVPEFFPGLNFKCNKATVWLSLLENLSLLVQSIKKKSMMCSIVSILYCVLAKNKILQLKMLFLHYKKPHITR